MTNTYYVEHNTFVSPQKKPRPKKRRKYAGSCARRDVFSKSVSEEKSLQFSLNFSSNILRS